VEEQLILEVSQVNSYIKEMMDSDNVLSGLCIRGELSNYKIYPSGHHYFTLKDREGALKCVMFRSNASRMRFRPENGMRVLAAGRITVYPRDGAYQLYCVSMRPEGQGDLAVAFEQLKRKLEAEGLFDERHKKPIPDYPHRIALITSGAGAALRDMLRILGARYPLAEVKLLPVRVQGSEAPGEIAGAIDYANRYHVADLIITGRGGGSMEDLWAFNEEIVASAIYRSEIPVISAVGHEPDVTISDYVADLRAATPSNAAELAVPDQAELRSALKSQANRMAQSLTRRLNMARVQLDARRFSRVLREPDVYLEIRRQTLDGVTDQLAKAMSGLLRESQRELRLRHERLMPGWCGGQQKRMQRCGTLSARLDVLSPLKVLSRGYSITENVEGTAVISAEALKPGDYIKIRLAHGAVEATVDRSMEE